MDILSEFGINPYELLGVDVSSNSIEVKKAYKSKAKILHPDKTGGKTEAEFKLLVLSYKYVVKNCVDTPVASFQEMKEAPREEKHYHKNFYDINFEDADTRNQIFVDDDINLEEFEKQMKKSQGGSTTYSAENYYKKEVLETMKTNGKFDKVKFNAFFNKLQKDGKIPNQLVKKEKVLASNASKEYVNVNTYDDMMVNSIDKVNGNYRKFLQQTEVNSDDITKLVNIDKKVLDKLIKDTKKDTGKISRKKMRELEEKAKVIIPVDTTLTFEQAKQKMLLEQINDIHDSHKKQKEYVMKNKRIFVNSIAYN
jgi:hypothetical protein